MVFLLKPRCFACGKVNVCNKSSLGRKIAHSDKLFVVDVSSGTDFVLFQLKKNHSFDIFDSSRTDTDCRLFIDTLSS